MTIENPVIALATDELRRRFSTFNDLYEYDEDEDDTLIYLAYGGFGMFTLDIINLFMGQFNQAQSYFNVDLKAIYNTPDLIHKELKEIFSYVDEMFSKGDAGMNDILNTCIFEAWMGNDFSYNLARKHLNIETYNHYLEVTKRVL